MGSGIQRRSVEKYPVAEHYCTLLTDRLIIPFLVWAERTITESTDCL